MVFTREREHLVKMLIQQRYIKSPEVEQAFLHTSREVFIPERIQSSAYQDTPLEIGLGQTISAPHMVAIMCEALDIHKGQKILEIGAGSGYHAAIVSYLVGNQGHVYSVERHEPLVQTALKNLKEAQITNVSVLVGDGSLGCSEFAPYDRIYVTCAAPSVPPPLIEQLKESGKLLVPVGDMYCRLQRIVKNGTKYTTEDLGGCVFVPLVGRYGH